MTTAEHDALVSRAQFAEQAAHRRLTEAYASAAQAEELKMLTGNWATAAKTLATLAPVETRNAAPPDDARTIGLVAGHLVPLELAAPDMPLEEHARLAADMVRRAMPPAAPAKYPTE